MCGVCGICQADSVVIGARTSLHESRASQGSIEAIISAATEFYGIGKGPEASELSICSNLKDIVRNSDRHTSVHYHSQSEIHGEI